MRTWRGIGPGETSIGETIFRAILARIIGPTSAYPDKALAAISAAIQETTENVD